MPDHMIGGAWTAMPALAVAATVTRKLRVGTLVIDRGIGTLREIRGHIVRLRDAIGITYFCLRGPDVESLGPVVGELTGR